MIKSSEQIHLESKFDESKKDKLCVICGEKREYSIQIGKKGNDVTFCDLCGQIVARGIHELERKGWLTINE